MITDQIPAPIPDPDRPTAAVISDSNKVTARKVTTPAITAPQETFFTSPRRSSPRASSFQEGLGGS